MRTMKRSFAVNSIRIGAMSESLASVMKTFLLDNGSVTFFCIIETS